MRISLPPLRPMLRSKGQLETPGLAAEKADEHEIVEVTRLQRGVLPIVGESEQLSFF